jgi:hypothetical protein
MSSNAAVKFAPVFSEDKRVDMSLVDGEAQLVLSTWTDGLGWCAQKTMHLDPDLLDEVHRVVTAARLKLKRDQPAENAEPAKVLKFPELM